MRGERQACARARAAILAVCFVAAMPCGADEPPAEPTSELVARKLREVRGLARTELRGLSQDLLEMRAGSRAGVLDPDDVARTLAVSLAEAMQDTAAAADAATSVVARRAVSDPEGVQGFGLRLGAILRHTARSARHKCQAIARRFSGPGPAGAPPYRIQVLTSSPRFGIDPNGEPRRVTGVLSVVAAGYASKPCGGFLHVSGVAESEPNAEALTIRRFGRVPERITIPADATDPRGDIIAWSTAVEPAAPTSACGELKDDGFPSGEPVRISVGPTLDETSMSGYVEGELEARLRGVPRSRRKVNADRVAVGVDPQVLVPGTPIDLDERGRAKRVFTPQESGMFEISATGTLDGVPLDVTLRVREADGEVVLGDDDDHGKRFGARVVATLTGGTNYEFVVAAWLDQGPDATLALTSSGSKRVPHAKVTVKAR